MVDFLVPENKFNAVSSSLETLDEKQKMMNEYMKINLFTSKIYEKEGQRRFRGRNAHTQLPEEFRNHETKILEAPDLPAAFVCSRRIYTKRKQVVTLVRVKSSRTGEI